MTEQTNNNTSNEQVEITERGCIIDMGLYNSLEVERKIIKYAQVYGFELDIDKDLEDITSLQILHEISLEAELYISSKLPEGVYAGGKSYQGVWGIWEDSNNE